MSITRRFHPWHSRRVGDVAAVSTSGARPDVLGNTTEEDKERATNHLNFIGGAVVGLVVGFVATSMLSGRSSQ